MPDGNQIPQTPLQTQLGSGWLNDAPGGDSSLDELFPNPELQSQVAPAPAAAPPQAPAAPADEWFLVTPTGTKYRTREDAIKGITEKDRVISEQRQKTAPQPVQTPADDPTRYFDELVESASKGDKKGYLDTFGRIVEQTIQQRLGVYGPMLTEVSHEKAIRELEHELPGSRQFIESGEFAVSLEAEPLLAQAIQFAKDNPQAAAQLHDLYRVSYLAAQGRKTAEFVRSAAANQPAPQVNTRAPMQTSTPTPTPGVQRVAQPDLYSREGRKAIIDAGDTRGVGNLDWKQLGL